MSEESPPLSLTITCPACKAAAGEQCQASSPKPGASHWPRLRAALQSERSRGDAAPARGLWL